MSKNLLRAQNSTQEIFSESSQIVFKGTKPDTRLPKSRAGGQGPYLRLLDHLGRSSEAKDRKKTKKVKCDGWTDRLKDGRTDGPTDKAGCRVP